MTKTREREIEGLFRSYAANKRLLNERYSIPQAQAVQYDKICIQTDKSSNPVEMSVINYIARREELFKKVFIVEEVIQYFWLEDYGRDRFIKVLLLENSTWTKTEQACNISRETMSRWRRDVFEKVERVAELIHYELKE
jgi:hypothetical protein